MWWSESSCTACCNGVAAVTLITGAVITSATKRCTTMGGIQLLAFCSAHDRSTAASTR